MTDFAARDAEVVEAAGTAPGTMLSDVMGDLTAKVATPPFSAEIPGRPGYAIRLTTDIAFRRVQAITKECWDKKLDALDRVKFAAMIALTFTEAVLKNGEELVDDDGAVLTLRSAVWLDVYGVIDRLEVPKRFFGRDVDLINAVDQWSAIVGGPATEEGEQPEPDPLS